MNIDDLRARLEGASFEIEKEDRLGNDTGVQVRLKGGGIVNLFDKGTIQVQGKDQERIKEVLADEDDKPQKAAVSPGPVFVVYGHDTDARNQLEAMLRKWGIDPLILDQLPTEGQTIIEKLEKHTDGAGFAVVLATPDDEGHRAGRPDEKSYRARQNVVLELGMLLSKLGRKRVAILLKDQENMERPSDIQGLIYIPFKTDIRKEAGVLLAKEMDLAGYKIDVRQL